MFVVLEGIDGCGKSTHARLLTDWLESEGKAVRLTAEPTKGKIGLFIREILSGNHSVDPKTLALLFTADRYEHINREIEPALDEGKIIISERYYHSTIAYQESQGVDREWLIDINKFARKPDITILLDVEPGRGVERTQTQEIFENREFLETVRENYLKQDKGMIKVDGNRSIDDVLSELKKIIGERL